MSRSTDSEVLEEGGRSKAPVSASNSQEVEEFEAMPSDPISIGSEKTSASRLSRVSERSKFIFPRIIGLKSRTFERCVFKVGIHVN